MTYAFGTFRLDTARRLLFSGEEMTPLPERAFQLLLLLIEAGGEVVTKETLAAKAWPESAVSDANLSQHIYLLRRMLREKASDRSYIMTVSGRGFRFAAPVEMTPVAAAVQSVRSNAGADPFWEYCRGIQLLERPTARHLWTAVEAFENAVRLNDTCARYFVGLARGYSLLAEFGYAPAASAYAKARTAIGHAITIEPSSPPAHAVFSEVLLFGDWDWNGARGASDRALRLDSRSTLVRRNAARLYIALGEYASARVEAQHALMLDPSCRVLQMLFAQAALLAGDYDQAIAVLSNLIELEPGCYTARRGRAEAFLAGGNPEGAIRDLQLLPRGDETNSTDFALLSRAFAESGDAAQARQTHAELLDMCSNEHAARVNLAASAMGLGEEREAMQHLERAYQHREPALIFLKGLRWFDPIRNTPEYAQLLANIGPSNRSNRMTIPA